MDRRRPIQPGIERKKDPTTGVQKTPKKRPVTSGTIDPRRRASSGTTASGRTGQARSTRTAAENYRGTPRTAGSAAYGQRGTSGRNPNARSQASAAARRRAAMRKKQQRRARMIRLGIVAAVLLIVIILIFAIPKKAPEPAVPAVPAEEVIQETPIEEPDDQPEAFETEEAEEEPADAFYDDATEEAADELTIEANTIETPSVAANTSDTENFPDYEIAPNGVNTINPIGVPQCERVPDSYFDDAVFVGDSITLALSKNAVYYRKKGRPDFLGKAEFLPAGGMGYRDAVREITEDSHHPTYQGKKMLVEDAIQAMGAKKVYIMMGMNDVAMANAEKTTSRMLTLCKRIREKSPDTIIFIQSCTPRAEGNYSGDLNNENLFNLDIAMYEALRQFEGQGLYFVDVAYALRDENGWLPTGLCSDLKGKRLHMNGEGIEIWTDYLYTHVPRELMY